MLLHPNKSQISDLQLICQISAEMLTTLRSRLELDSANVILDPEQLVQIAQNVITNAGKAKSLIRQLLSLHGFMRRAGCSVEELLAGLRDGLDGRSEFPLEAWKTIEATFGQLLVAKAIRHAATAVELRYDYTNLVKHARILSDIRPLFSSNADEIEASVVSFTLRIEYTSDDGDHEVSLALDASDVKRLEAACKRALVKAETARQFMEGSSVPTVISGKEDR